MGTWGTGVFSNDLSCDVRGDYRELLEDGMPDAEATQEILRRYEDSQKDTDNGACFWTGLAATQKQLGRLDSAVRDRTIEVIDRGADLHMYDDPGLARKREATLAKLRADLLGPQKSPVKVRRPTPIPCPVRAGDVFLLSLDDGRKARLRTLSVTSHRLGEYPIVELVDDRGRPYRQYYPEDDIRAKVVTSGAPARWEVFSLFKHLPAPDDIQVIAREPNPKSQLNVTSSLDWRGLRHECARLLDEPRAQPKR